MLERALTDKGLCNLAHLNRGLYARRHAMCLKHRAQKKSIDGSRKHSHMISGNTLYATLTRKTRTAYDIAPTHPYANLHSQIHNRFNLACDKLDRRDLENLVCAGECLTGKLYNN